MRAALLALILAAGPALAQEPSEAERASQSQRAMTAAERALQAEGCTLGAVPTGEEPVIAGVETIAFDLPEITVLRLIDTLAAAPSGAGDLRRLPDLPLGGVGARDICRPVMLRYEGTAAGPSPDAVGSFALILRRGLDLIGDYPTTGAEIARRGQTETIPAGRYVAVRARDAERLIAALPRLARHDTSRPAILLGDEPIRSPDFALIPIRSE